MEGKIRTEGAGARLRHSTILLEAAQRNSGADGQSIGRSLRNRRRIRTAYNCLLAECHLETGNRERARELIEHGLVTVAQNDEHCSEAKLLRIQAAILRDVGVTRSKVVTVLTRSLAVAERQSATSLRLRILSDWITYELEYADSSDMVACSTDNRIRLH